MLLLSSVTTARRRPALPAGVMHRAVDIWSEGTRMTGDLYWPAAAGDQRLPAIVMRHGWGGKKAGLVRNAVTFAADGFVVFAFDYRGCPRSRSVEQRRCQSASPWLLRKNSAPPPALVESPR